MTITLQDITPDNFQECIHLSVYKEQEKFVASNIYSIAESKIFPFWMIKAIYSDAIMVGFLMYAKDHENGKLDVSRLMIDCKFQGKGYGKEALNCILRIAKEDEEIDQIVIHVEKENINGKQFYKNYGFEDMRMMEYGEEVFIFRINQ
jgi:diamine N-acetyltransferase